MRLARLYEQLDLFLQVCAVCPPGGKHCPEIKVFGGENAGWERASVLVEPGPGP
ncbi:hypothetical protein CLV97_1408 [Planifilum fimeticola]|uniref:Uncharacterized protein n=1 Tax=Planifilum fimeticola TaxID=201975 RepID=A0A2T0LA74_9BACL|nr:hypothetical protein CLV97_1408 [Planifilum fimeticola]